MEGNRGSYRRIDGRREGTCDINNFIEMRREGSEAGAVCWHWKREKCNKVRARLTGRWRRKRELYE